MKFKEVSIDFIDKVMGKSTKLWLVVNANHEDLETAIIYEFSKAELKKNTDLASFIFGRINSVGAFKSTKLVTNILATNYINHAIDVVNISDIQKIADNKGVNLGVAVEYLLADKFDGKHGTIKQDKELKQDIICRHSTIQIKCSLQTATTKKSYSTTNS